MVWDHVDWVQFPAPRQKQMQPDTLMVVIDERRIRILKESPKQEGPIVYWMSRDQRVQDNWALLHAQNLAFEHKKPLLVIFCLAPVFLDATIRQYDFMIQGLQGVEKDLAKLSIPFKLLLGDPVTEIPKYISSVKAGLIVTDFDPLKIKRMWKEKIAKVSEVTIVEVDTHNIVPCWHASPKQEFAAYTLRPKIHKILDEFLTQIPPVKTHPFNLREKILLTDWKAVRDSLKVNMDVKRVDIAPGESAAFVQLKEFLEYDLKRYDTDRNDPTKDAQSNLSPYLHFGNISAQRIVLELRGVKKHLEAKKQFQEELVIRKELSDNFCYYNEHYDSPKGFPDWAKKTIAEHANDPREYVYTQEEFEYSKTHDELWNAAQQEMVVTGKMHGYMRMYWAKKILEWTHSAEDAMRIAIYLNDKYELDGRDPNGYTGIAWSIGGVHDRAWFDRPIFGKIRYMSYNGCKSKFDVAAYIRQNLNTSLGI